MESRFGVSSFLTESSITLDWFVLAEAIEFRKESFPNFFKGKQPSGSQHHDAPVTQR